MNKKNFTLDDIDYFLDEFGFVWVERLIYNPNTNKYKQLKINNFNGVPKFLSLKNLRTGNRTLMLAEIDNKTFIMSADKYKIDASAAWEDYLNEKIRGKANEC